MNSLVVPGSYWRYVGPGGGRDLRHVVADILEDEETGELRIVTWSDPTTDHAPGASPVAGYSWMGDHGMFTKHFVPWVEPVAA